MCNDLMVFIHATDKKSLLQNFISGAEAVTNNVIWDWANRRMVIEIILVLLKRLQCSNEAMTCI